MTVLLKLLFCLIYQQALLSFRCKKPGVTVKVTQCYFKYIILSSVFTSMPKGKQSVVSLSHDCCSASVWIQQGSRHLWKDIYVTLVQNDEGLLWQVELCKNSRSPTYVVSIYECWCLVLVKWSMVAQLTLFWETLEGTVSDTVCTVKQQTWSLWT